MDDILKRLTNIDTVLVNTAEKVKKLTEEKVSQNSQIDDLVNSVEELSAS